jgi:hypothetical protein
MALPSDPGGGPATPGMSVDQAYNSTDTTKIDVDITSISQFAEVLRCEIEENLQPTWRRIQTTLDKGGQFGLSPELSELHAKRLEYDRYLNRAKNLFSGCHRGCVPVRRGRGPDRGQLPEGGSVRQGDGGGRREGHAYDDQPAGRRRHGNGDVVEPGMASSESDIGLGAGDRRTVRRGLLLFARRGDR